MEFSDWARNHLGASRLDMLRERKEATIKYTKAVEKEIAAHYKGEHEKMMLARKNGATGRLEFESWV